MNWEDERWVKMYTRDSVTWLSWDWRARFVMMSLIRKVDRAGVVDVGSRGTDALASLLDIPSDIVRDGVAQLVLPNDDGKPTIVWNGPQLVLLNFIDAQEAKASSSARQKASRERRRDFAARGVQTLSRCATTIDPVTLRDSPAEDMGHGNEDLGDSRHNARRTPAEHVTPRGRVTSSVTRRDKDPIVADALALFARHFLARYGHRLGAPTKQQRERVREQLDAVGEDGWRDRVVRAFNEERDFPRHPYDLRTFLQFFDQFAASSSATNGRANGSFHAAVMRSIEGDRSRTLRMPWESDDDD